MSTRPPHSWSPPQYRASEYERDTLRHELPGSEPELGERDTIAVPLVSADTLPCPRLEMDELPTLRASPAELAALVARTRLPPTRLLLSEPTPLTMPRLAAPRPAQEKAAYLAPPASPVNRAHPLDRTLAVRLPDPGRKVQTRLRQLPEPGPDMQTQLCRLPHHGSDVQTQVHLPNHGPSVQLQLCRLPEPGPNVPTQLWFAPVAPLTVGPRPVARGLWARLWSLFGLPARRRAPVYHPGYHRQQVRRRE